MIKKKTIKQDSSPDPSLQKGDLKDKPDEFHPLFSPLYPGIENQKKLDSKIDKSEQFLLDYKLDLLIVIFIILIGLYGPFN